MNSSDRCLIPRIPIRRARTSPPQQIFPTQSVAWSKRVKPNLFTISRHRTRVATMSEQCRDAVENKKSNAHLSEDGKENSDVACGTLKVLSDDGRASELRDSLSSSLEGLPSKQLAAENDIVAIAINATSSKDMFPGKELNVAQTPNNCGSPFLAASTHSSPGAVVPPPLMPFNMQKDDSITGGACASTGAFIFGSQPEGTAFTFGSHAAGAAFTIGASSTDKSVLSASTKSNLVTTKPATSGYGSLCSAKDFTFSAPPPKGVQTKLPQMDTRPFKSVSATLLQSLNGKNEPKKRRVVETGKSSALSSFAGSGLPAALPTPLTSAPVDLSSSTVSPGERAVHISNAAANTVEPIHILDAMQSMSLVPAVSPFVPAYSPGSAVSALEGAPSVTAYVPQIFTLLAGPAPEVPVSEAPAPDPVIAAAPTSTAPSPVGPAAISLVVKPAAIVPRPRVPTIIHKPPSNIMVPIKKSDIPAYLHHSEFYRNLQDTEDEDETILVPSDCMKMDDTIENSDDLYSLLLTMRFWVAGCTCDTLLEYLLNRPYQYPDATLPVFYADFPVLKHFATIAKAKEPIRKAIDSGNFDIVKYYLKRGHAWPTDAVERIVKVGNEEMLNSALQAGCMIRKGASETAAAEGHLGCLRLLRERCKRCNLATALGAALGGHLECLKFAHQQGSPLTKDVLKNAAQSGNIDCVKYIHESGFPLDRKACIVAADNYDIRMVLFLLQCGCPPCNGIWQFKPEEQVQHFHRVLDCFLELGLHWAVTPEATVRTASSGSLECLKLLIENGCPWHPKTMSAVVKTGKLELMVFAHENGCPWELETCAQAAGYAIFDCLEYAHTHGAEIAPDVCAKMFEFGGRSYRVPLKCLQYVHQHGAVLRRTLTFSAVENGCRLDVLEYLHEQGCEWDPRAPEWAAHCGLAQLLEFMLSHGCPCTEAVRNYALMGRNAVCMALVEKYKI